MKKRPAFRYFSNLFESSKSYLNLMFIQPEIFPPAFMKLIINYDYQNPISVNLPYEEVKFGIFIQQIAKQPLVVLRDAFHKTRDQLPMYMLLIGRSCKIDEKNLKGTSKEIREVIEQIFQCASKGDQPTTAILIHQDQDRFFKLIGLQKSK